MRARTFLFIFIGILLFGFISSAEFSLVKISELQIGDVIIDSNDNEVIVESIVYTGDLTESSKSIINSSKKSGSLMDLISEKINGRSLPPQIISGGNSLTGLSIGEYGTGVKVEKGSETHLEREEMKQKKSFWDKLFFWRSK